MGNPEPARVWTVAEAKARLSEVLRRAEEEGPQRIGTRKSFVVVSESTWQSHVSAREPLGQWLVENMPRGVELDIPDRREPGREIPFTDVGAEVVEEAEGVEVSERAEGVEGVERAEGVEVSESGESGE